jgi:hypothetical protein
MKPATMEAALRINPCVDAYFKKHLTKYNEEDRFTDLLTDLMHYAKVQNIDFAECFERAKRHFKHES